MTFRKLFMDHYKNRLWIVAICVLGAVLHYGLIPALFLGGNRVRIVAETNPFVTVSQAMQMEGARWFTFSLIVGILDVMVLAIVMGIQEFTYLYKNSSVDFYDSQPVAFRSRFLNNYLCGIILFAVVYAIGMLLGMAVIGVTGAGCSALYMGIFESWLWFLVLFAGMYSMAVLGAVVSGNLFTAFLASSFIAGIEFLARMIITGCMNQYFTTIYHMSNADLIRPRSLPLAWYYTYMEQVMKANIEKMEFVTVIPQAFASSGTGLIISLVITGIAAGLAYKAFVMRPREAVEKGLCFPVLESAVKISLGILGGILAGMMADLIFTTVFHFSIISFLIIALVVALICMTGECIFSLNITKVFRRSWQMPVCMIASMAVIIMFKQDAFGYDRYLPEASQVESCAFYPQDNYSYSIISEDKDGNPVNLDRESYFLENLKITDLEDILEIAGKGMAERRKIYGADTVDYGNIDTWNSIVMYRMNNGRKVWRQLEIPYDIDKDLMDAVTGNNEYKDVYYDTERTYKGLEDAFSLDEKGKLTLSYNTRMNNTSEVIDLKTMHDILTAYKKDLAKYDYSYIKSHDCLATMDINFSPDAFDMDELNMYQTFPVYDGYDNVIAVLKENNLYTEPLPDISDIAFILARHEVTDDTGDVTDSNTVIYDDPEKIKEILGLCDINITGDWANYHYNNDDLTIMIINNTEAEKGGKTDDMDYYWNTGLGSTLSLKAENIPGYVKKDLDM